MYKFLFILATSVFLLSCEDSTTNSSTTSGDERTSSKIENTLHKHIAVLASDEFEGRAPATPGEEKTINYLRANFAELGVGPGNGESYFQSVAVTELTTASNATLYIQGSDLEASFNYGYEANTQNLLFGCWGLVEGAVLVAQKLLLLTTVL